MEPFTISLTGLGEQTSIMVVSLSPLFAAVVGTILAVGAFSWGRLMFLRTLADGDSKIGWHLRGVLGVRAHWVRDYLDGNSEHWR